MPPSPSRHDLFPTASVMSTSLVNTLRPEATGSPAKRRSHEWRAGGREIRGHHLYVVLFKQGRSTRPSRVRYGLFHGVPAFRGGRAWEPGVRDSPGDNNREIVGHHRGLSDPFVHGVPEFPATGSVWEPTPTGESPSADPTIIDVIAVSSYGRGMPSPLEDGEHRRTRTATDAHGPSNGRRVTATHNAPKWQAREPATTTDSIPPPGPAQSRNPRGRVCGAPLRLWLCWFDFVDAGWGTRHGEDGRDGGQHGYRKRDEDQAEA